MGTLLKIIGQTLSGLLVFFCGLVALDLRHAVPIPSAPRVVRAAVPDVEPEA
jgi:hypothetical protein